MSLTGKIIAIEGLDGAGKSSQIQLLKSHLNCQGIKYKHIHFPRVERAPHGTLIANFLRGEYGAVDKVAPQLVALLFALDRNDSKQEILNTIHSNKTVILDRYVYSNIAFQCAKLDTLQEKELLAEWIIDYEFKYLNIPKPDISIFLDVPFSFIKANLSSQRSGDSRAYLNGKDDIHEDSINLQMNVLNEYKQLATKNSDLIHIQCYDDRDSSLFPPDKIHSLILHALKSWQQ